ncbi:hypothetical protein J2X45_003946 [Caulobacter sp. BE264]|uniref:hypothetical protein n=1 Tax=Caulobacter sp. BE264 TaxID=2817724 RepID=UPI0028575245|nr:hypothetical protein [Caulobacter sp. BE264]MDR7232836.1 hypothetical protein [Caulobacter sp. BE264]
MNLTPPEVRALGDFPSRNTADADAYVAAASTWGATAPLWATDLVALGDWMATLAADQAAAFPPGAIVVTYTFDGLSATVGDPGAGKVRLNNLTQGSATAMLADALDNLGVSALATLARMTSTSAPLGSLVLYKFGDPSRRLNADVTANTPSGGGTGHVNLTLTNVAVSTANPFADGDSLVLVLDPRGAKGDTGAPGATSLWTTDGTYNITGTPTLVTIPLPTGAATCRLSFEGVTIASTQSLTVALSTNGSSFGTAAGFGSASGTMFTGFLSLEGLGRNRLSLEDRVVAGASVPSSPNMSGEGPPNQRFATTIGGATHIQFAVNGGLAFTGGTIVAEKK